MTMGTSSSTFETEGEEGDLENRSCTTLYPKFGTRVVDPLQKCGGTTLVLVFEEGHSTGKVQELVSTTKSLLGHVCVHNIGDSLHAIEHGKQDGSDMM